MSSACIAGTASYSAGVSFTSAPASVKPYYYALSSDTLDYPTDSIRSGLIGSLHMALPLLIGERLYADISAAASIKRNGTVDSLTGPSCTYTPHTYPGMPGTGDAVNDDSLGIGGIDNDSSGSGGNTNNNSGNNSGNNNGNSNAASSGATSGSRHANGGEVKGGQIGWVIYIVIAVVGAACVLLGVVVLAMLALRSRRRKSDAALAEGIAIAAGSSMRRSRRSSTIGGNGSRLPQPTGRPAAGTGRGSMAASSAGHDGSSYRGSRTRGNTDTHTRFGSSW